MKYPVNFRWAQKHEDYCLRHKIHLKFPEIVKGIYKKRNIFLFKKGERIKFTEDVWVEEYASMPRKSFCSMGAYSYACSKLPNNLKTGRFCSLAAGVRVMGPQHPIHRFTTSPLTYHDFFPKVAQEQFGETLNIAGFDYMPEATVLGHDVWVGEHAVLKGGITIGNGAIIAANAVVTSDVPPYAIVAGIPARVIKYRFEKSIINRLQSIQWWNYKITDLPDFAAADDIVKFADEMEDKIRRKVISEHHYKVVNIAQELAEI
ncbi:CatB-related O-acetyltransferase [Rahnella aquatilis]|jgi:acetyltransferase-like isoleucine patch superfamily enzyme|uniref:CatB-related O-acetyltransferase n=2 Tax=Rahnella sp. (strain Y9602) TaxID=2703885 RepID=A0ABW6CG90_RAHSY|nr:MULTISPECIES: CatB-related O-acetyltransferase [Rahnella]AYA05956.1 antibiotic acetyltransferase [Rahnella aquatilis]AZP41190.1 CatB-related O-acetyltransferase [Rahnella aquatilis]AZP45531.1 CatB-related O-acetyltransferase [Rahnella aquatilis]AZP49903.1 CatB-related O-acetyltransferase [Rahnella aquatilis]MBU9840153.1 CatB-related O-acetyltransferase [Rahnella aceris]